MTPSFPLARTGILCLLIASAAVLAGCSEDTGAGSDNINDQSDTEGMDAVDVPLDPEPDTDADPSPEPDATLEDEIEVECTENTDCDDGIFCNGRERCSEGVCFDSPQPPCVDNIDCTVDRCDDTNQQCVFVADDSLCAEGQVCDLKAGCFAPSECTRDEDCDDGLVCNGVESCVNNSCQPGTPLQCDDGIDCTDDSCDEEIGDCQITPNHTFCLPNEFCNIIEDCTPRPPCTNDDDCDDASFCNGTELCNLDTGECEPGERPVVADELDCTVDACSERLAMVTHTPNPSRCTDGEFCNGAEVCHPVNGCQAGEPPVLSDGVGCTQDRCDEEADFIEHLPDHGLCDDDLFCNGAEVCHPIEGCSPGEPLPINDGVGCTVDTCSEVEQRILHIATDELCDDGLFCNGTETCDPEAGCQSGAAPVTDDLIGCTDDTCDEANDRVVHTPNDGACSDNLFCNGTETCDPNEGCQPGIPLVIDDLIACTADSCDEEADEILHEPDNGLCSDDLFCNGVEVCTPGQGCGAGVPPSLEDGVGCTVDACDEVNNTITHTPTDALCDDDLFCNGAETCDPIDDCVGGTPPVVDDLIACTSDTCDEANNRVVHTPNHELCEGEVCTGGGQCQVGVGCVDGQAPDDGFVCNNDPRSICLDESCEASVCNDGFVDEGAGEECDDENNDNDDGCDANCQFEVPDSFDYNGTYDIPTTSYFCDVLGIPVIDYSFDEMIFSVNNNTLTVAARPRGTPDVVMSQTPAPIDGTFDVSVTVPGTCDETYRLVGRFITEDRWVASFSRTLSGFCFECTDALLDINGTRQE